MNSVFMAGLKPRALRWWQTHTKLLLGLGVSIALIMAFFLVLWVPHRQVAPLKAKIQRERTNLQPQDRLKLEHEARKLETDARAAIIQAVGGTVLLIGLFFTWRSIRTTERNLQITQDTATKNLQLTQDRQITEHYTRAVEQLGSDKLEVCLGAIYALERIARDSERDHWPIMEILTACVREHAPWARQTPPPQLDTRMQAIMQAILTVLGRRPRTYGQGEDQRLNLEHTDLRGAKLQSAHLEGANLDSAHLEEAVLVDAHLEEAVFTFAHLEKAVLRRAHLEGARLGGAHLENAVIGDAHLEKASLPFAHLEGAVLIETHLEGASPIEAHLERALLIRAHLEGADLLRAHLEGADLEDAHLEGAVLLETHLKGARNLTVEQLATVKTLYNADLDPSLLEQIKQQYPHLREPPADIRF